MSLVIILVLIAYILYQYLRICGIKRTFVLEREKNTETCTWYSEGLGQEIESSPEYQKRLRRTGIAICLLALFFITLIVEIIVYSLGN